jgi:hypothetical protein
MEVFEIGSAVLLDGDIPATITSINIRGTEHRLTYEVTWWDERNRKTEWVDPFEIRAKEAKKQSLRFVAA